MFCKCLCWFEAVRGRLIGSKSWNRSVEIFGEFLEPIWTVRDCVGGCLFHNLLKYFLNEWLELCGINRLMHKLDVLT